MPIATCPQDSIEYGGTTIDGVSQTIVLNAGTAQGYYPLEGAPVHGASRGPARGDDVRQSYALSANTCAAMGPKTAIIIPTKNEPLDRLETVLSGISPGILVVLVSNSSRTPSDDKYKKEVDLLRRHCRAAGNLPALAIHQKDIGAGEAFEAFEAVRVANLTDSDHRIRNGKGEGMLLGLALVAIFCPERQYVGFVDSDNTVPGSVAEYCNAFAWGFHMHREEPNIMVRIQWGSKPKAVKNRIDYAPEGRSSAIVNKHLNRLLGYLSPTNTGGLMVTGNAGEHAMTMNLALTLPLAGGYAIEPYQIMALLFLADGDPWRAHTGSNGTNGQVNGNGAHRCAHHPPGRFSARVVQVKTRNPHLHRPGDEEHIRGMVLEGLGTMYHRLPSSHSRGHNGPNTEWQAQFRSEMLAYLEREGFGRTVPPPPRVYPPLGSLDLRKMHSIMSQNCRTLEVIGPYKLGTTPRGYNPTRV